MVNICHSCERPYEVREATIEWPYQYTESGLPNIRLAGVTVYSCSKCQLESADIPNMDGLHNLISKDIILTPLPMTGAELRFLRKEASLKPKEFAERLGVDPKTIANWENSEKLNRQVDVAARVILSLQLFQGDDLMAVIGQFVELAKYDWDDPSDETEAEIVPDLSPTATFDLDEDQKWDFPKAA